MSKRKKGKKKTHTVWNEETYEKVAKAVAASLVRQSQAGGVVNVAAAIREGQADLPEKLQRPHMTAIVHFPESFAAMVEAERERLISRGKPKETVEHKTVNGKAKGVELILDEKNRMGYALPPSLITSEKFREALKHAGFKFVTAPNWGAIPKTVDNINIVTELPLPV